MKTLYLIRHAKSSWDYSELSDEERPLNSRGKRDAPDMGERLAKHGLFPDLMLSSPANRALTTCKIIAKKLDYPEEAIEIDDAIYLTSSSDLLSVIRGIDNTWNTVCLFGHNPGFTDLANRLTGDDLDNLPTCSVYGCEFNLDNWKDADFGKGKKVFYDYPKSRKS